MAAEGDRLPRAWKDRTSCAVSARGAHEHSLAGQPFTFCSEGLELVEAASRTNRPADARAALSQLASATQSSGTRWGLGVLARSQGLLSEGPQAEDYYAEALRLLEPTRCLVDFARTSLAYGEWLRRQRRLSDSREHLSQAVQLFESIGATGFAGRGVREPRAAGVASLDLLRNLLRDR